MKETRKKLYQHHDDIMDYIYKKYDLHIGKMILLRFMPLGNIELTQRNVYQLEQENDRRRFV
jgi:hypothetical protein